MRSAVLGLVLGIQALVTSVAFADAAATVDPVYGFIQGSLVGHPVKMSRTTTLAGTDVVSDFTSTNFISNLQRTERGLTFDLVFNVTQVNHMPNPDGTTRDVVGDRIGVQRCELAAARSAEAPDGVLIGFCHATANSSYDVTGSASMVNARMENGALVMRTTFTTAGDCFANTASSFRLCTSLAVDTWSIVNGKVQRVYDGKNFWVTDFDAWTLQDRGPSPASIAVEE